MTKMREQAGFTNGELMGLLKLNTLNNQTQEETNIQIMGAAKAYAGKNKLAINEKEILKEISKSSASLTLSLGGGTEKLAESVVKAKQFGINLQQAEGIASSLLDFESSIENELSAELITGKSLNLEKARGLALSGDAVGAATEMLKQVGSAKKFGDISFSFIASLFLILLELRVCQSLKFNKNLVKMLTLRCLNNSQCKKNLIKLL